MNGSREDPASVAKWFREEAGLADVDRIEPEDISERHGLRVQPVEFDGLWGAAMVQGDVPGILIKEDQYPPRYRFTYAHEMGHIFLPQHYALLAEKGAFVDKEIRQASPDSELESEANEFAAELLAPAGRVRTQLRTGDLDMAAACEIQKAFGLSLTAAALRVVDVTRQDVAVVRFNEDQLRWKYESDDFPFGVPWNEWRAPRGSATADVIAGKGNEKDAVEISPQTWLVDRKWEKYPPRMLESCMRLGHTGGFLTMLWVP